MRMRAVLFDWDGTLLDSAEACYRVYCQVFAEEGIPFDRELFERTYSPNWQRTYASLGLPAHRWNDADRRYLELWAREEVPLRRGADTIVEALHRRGHPLGLVTSGEHARVGPELEHSGLRPRFAAIVCGDDVARKKPDPEGVQLALARLGVEPGEAAYVGDSPEDIEMARRASVLSIGVEGGFPNHGGLRASRPDVLIRALADLLQTL